MIHKLLRTLLCVFVLTSNCALLAAMCYVAKDKEAFSVMVRFTVGGMGLSTLLCLWIMLLDQLETHDK